MNFTDYNYRIGKTVKNWDICDGADYGSKWGLTDLYPNCEANLRTLLESGEDFCTEWYSKKELLSVVLMRISGKLTASVSAWTDDLWESDDLIYDAVWEATGREECLTEDTVSAIRDTAFEAEIDDHTCVSCDVPDDYDKLMDTISEMADAADKECNKWYQTLVEIVKEFDSLGELVFSENAE